MKMRQCLFLPLLCALVAAPALAQASGQTGKPAAAGNAADGRAAALFARWDTNRDHALSQAEFEAGWAALQRAVAVEMQLRKQFQVLDRDRDGALDAGEYAQLELVKRAGKAAPPLSDFDASKDQRLQFAEYVAAVAKLGAATAPAKGGK
jgi:Ca2+-binding EF-hand superfamily protein